MERPMRLSYMVVTPEVPYCPHITGLQGDLERSLTTLAQLGYDGAEFMTVYPNSVNRDFLVASCDRLNIVPTMVCTGELFGSCRLSFTDDDQAVADMAVKRVMECIDMAGELNTKINIGRVRGNVQSKPEKLYRAIEALRLLCDYAASKGVDVLLEPVESAELDFINSLSDGAGVLRKVERRNFLLMMDICAMFSESQTHAELIKSYAGLTRHIHLAEANRWFPGHNSSFEEIIATAAEARYHGTWSVEVLPHPGQYTAAEASMEHLAPLFQRYYNWNKNKLMEG